MDTRLREVWARGGVVLNEWLSIPSSGTAEIVARQDYDSIMVNLQHGLIDYQASLTMMQAIAAAGDATVIGQPPWLEPAIIKKLLDAREGAPWRGFLLDPADRNLRRLPQFPPTSRHDPEY